jgi:monoamine oxidase
VVLLEARDRLGGRTRTSEFEGRQVELGGTWVHWHQPHVWAELSRYGLELAESPPPTLARWFADGERHDAEMAAFADLMALGSDQLCSDAQQVFVRPHDPLFGNIEAIDRLSIEDRLGTLGLDEGAAAITRSLWQTTGSAYTDEVGLSAALRWYALSGFNFGLMMDCIARYKIARGTRALIEAMAADGPFVTRFDAPVGSVEQDANGVAVRLRDGTQLEARAAIVAVPLNVLGTISFSPPLNDSKRHAIEAGQASHGVKVWVRARGEVDRMVIGEPGGALTYLQPEYRVEGDTLLVGFGPDGGSLDATDHAAVVDAVSRLLPEDEITSSHGHDWVADEFARGTWSMYRPGQLTGALRALQEPEQRLVLAGSDVATGWNGFIDGAIESGFRAAQTMRRILPSPS